MDVITRVTELEPVAASLMHGHHRFHRLNRKGFAVERPLIEAVKCRIALDDRHLDRLVGWSRWGVDLSKTGVIPMEGLRLDPLGFPSTSRVLDDHAHSMPPIVLVQITEYPYAWLIHVNDGGDALGRAEPEHRDLRRRRNRITVQRHDAKDMAGQREASDLACAGIQHVHQDALARFDAQGFAKPKHLAVDGKTLVADFEAFGLLFRRLIGALPDLLQFADRIAREEVHRHVTATAEGGAKLLHDEKDFTVVGSGIVPPL